MSTRLDRPRLRGLVLRFIARAAALSVPMASTALATPPAASAAAAKPVAAAARPAAAPGFPRIAHPDWTVENRCASLAKMLRFDTVSAATTLGVPDPEAVGVAFDRGVQRWSEVCTTLPAEALGCLETADHVVAAIGRCGVHEGRKGFADRVFLPMLASEFVPWHSHSKSAGPASAEVTARVGAALVGVWQRKDSWATKVLTVAKDGSVRYDETRTTPGAKTTTQLGKLDVRGPFRAEVLLDSKTRFAWATFVHQGKLFTSNQTATGAYPIAASGETRLGSNGQFLLIDKLRSDAPACRMWGPRFDPMLVRCAWVKDGEQRLLEVVREASVSVESGSKMGAYPSRFGLVGDVVVPAQWLTGQGDAWERTGEGPASVRTP